MDSENLQNVEVRTWQNSWPNYEEMQKAWIYFWSRNRLGYDKNGRVIRTDEPRVMPLVRKFKIQ